MAASNIERFDEYVGIVLGHLYRQFPVPVLIDAELIGIDTSLHLREGPGGMGAVVEHLLFPDEQFFLHSIQWLVDAGYIQAKRSGDRFSGAVLTSRGLEVLKALPASLQSGPSLGEQLVDASKAGAKDMLRAVTTEALALGARFVSNQFGLGA